MKTLQQETGLNQRAIEVRADQILREAGVAGRFPVPLEAVAQHLGYASLGFDPRENPQLSEVAGMVDYSGKKLYVNKAVTLGRQRFTLAHEIGHAVLHTGGDNLVDFRSNIENPAEPREFEANKFAAALLMPRAEFARKWLEFRGNADLIARYFGVSPEAVRVRQAVTLERRM